MDKFIKAYHLLIAGLALFLILCAAWDKVHAQEIDDYNGINLGMGHSVRIDQHVELFFGSYRNSYYKDSSYAGFDLHMSDRQPVRYGVSVAMVDGYDNTPVDNNILVFPNITIGGQHIRLKVGSLPTGIKQITLTAGWRF